MSFNRCRFCDHRNPVGAKFCSACGGALHLMPCPRCGAVTDITATVCYQCRGQLPGRIAGSLEPAPAAAGVTKRAAPSRSAGQVHTSLPRLPALLIVGIAGVLGLIGVLGYYHRPIPVVEESRPLAAGSEGSEHSTAAPTEPKEGAVISRPEDVAEASEPKPAPREAACTDAVAALDLCAAQSVPKNEAETGAASQTGDTSSQITGVVNEGAQESPRPECTEAVTALGLCAQKPTRRNN